MQSPCNIDAEMAVLGSLMLGTPEIGQIMAILKPEMFYLEKHREIFTAQSSIWGQERPVELISVSEYLQRKSEALFESVGGFSYLVHLSELAPSAVYAENYSEIIRSLWQRRTAIEILGQSMRRLYSEDFADEKVILDKKLSEITVLQKEPEKLVYEHALDAIGRWEQGESKNMFSTSSKIDEIIAWQPKVVLIKSKTSVGKSIYGLQLALCAAKDGLKSVYFSLEMPPHEVAIRALAAYGKSPRRMKADMQYGRLEDIESSLEVLRNMNLEITSSETSDSQILRKTEERLRAGYKMVVVDYLQIVNMTTNAARRDIDLAMFTTALKRLQMKYGAIIVILSQVNSQGDARESQSTENDVNAILHIKREPFDDGRLSDEVDIFVEKNREGERGKVRLYHVPGRFLFMEGVE